MDCEEASRLALVNIFPFPSHELNEGLNYLGYRIKPNNYGLKDWGWLVSKVEKRISLWCNRWISRGGHLTLIKSVIEAIPVYWHFLANILKGILHRIRKLCCNYLWKGSFDYLGSHLVKW
jgi:hypothetical protein